MLVFDSKRRVQSSEIFGNFRKFSSNDRKRSNYFQIVRTILNNLWQSSLIIFHIILCLICDMSFVQKASYCFVSHYCSTDPSINLNFSIFLYNSGERKEAAKQFNIYERKMETYRSVKGNEIDQEVCLHLVHILVQPLYMQALLLTDNILNCVGHMIQSGLGSNSGRGHCVVFLIKTVVFFTLKGEWVVVNVNLTKMLGGGEGNLG